MNDTYWKSLRQLSQPPVADSSRPGRSPEFFHGAADPPDELTRRSFLKLSAASLTLAGLTACTKQPAHPILPYVRQPEGLVPGEPLVYATAFCRDGFANGVLVTSREGHPIKIEGNPDHPTTLGGSSVWMQASILDLYDPDRSRSVAHYGDISTWDLFLAALNDIVREQMQKRGAGLRFLTGTVTSPTLAAQIRALLQKFPEARWHQFEPINRDNVREGAKLAFGQVVETQYRFHKADVILALDADFLYTHPASLQYARQFAQTRRVDDTRRGMSRLYVAESTPSVTGSMADHRLRVASGEVGDLARQIVDSIGRLSARVGEQPWLNALGRDLREHRGASVIVAGEWQSPQVHALAHHLNEQGNVGRTVVYTESAEANPVNQQESLKELVNDMQAGRVEALFMLGGNPVYTSPADLEFAAQLAKVKQSIHLSSHLDETSALCTWHIPAAHYLESWGDSCAFDGTVSLIQPLITPLYGGKTPYELLGAVTQQQPIRNDYQIVRQFWQSEGRWPDFESGWRKALHDGFIPGTECKTRDVGVRTDALNQATHDASRITHLEINFRPDPSVWDGRFANNGWLQECPKPISKLVWDNALLISPTLARAQHLNTEDIVEVNVDGRVLRVPVWIMPGQADSSLTLHLGYGRTRSGRAGDGRGWNAYAIRASRDLWNTSNVRLVRTGRKHHLVATQTHHEIDDPERQVYRETTVADLLARASVIKESVQIPERDTTLYDESEYLYSGYRWGMSINLGTCIGCNACLVACEVENNIPVVGRDQVDRNREMFWIRVDTYFKGAAENPEFNHMPVPCMHCEHAPCELVCPVEATLHDREGLNLQVYNRCVGTRFCSNNCPYKVRRFNFYQYADYHTPSIKPMYNPDVTVRWRGVMEKCTYCIQRISRARITAEKENRRIRDGEIVTACQQACPAEAIVFGDLNDPNSRVSRFKQSALDYPMLGQLNTRPRTTYLAKVRNPSTDAPETALNPADLPTERPA